MTITKLQESQKTPYCLDPVYIVQEFITTLESIDENQFYSYSLICEPKPDKKQKLVLQVSEPKLANPDDHVRDVHEDKSEMRKQRASTQIDRFFASADTWVCFSIIFLCNPIVSNSVQKL